MRVRNLGMTVLAVYLLLVGLAGLVQFSFAGFGVLLAILAIAAGVLILAGR